MNSEAEVILSLFERFWARKSSCELLGQSSTIKTRWKRQDLVAAASGSGECCPLVVDPLTFVALLTFIAAAAYFLQGSLIWRKNPSFLLLCDTYDVFL
jgi:hypothetical protein